MTPNIRLIIRDVPITLDEATILSAGSFVSVKRLHRTKTGVAKPLPLVEVWCSGSEHVVEQLISHGLSLLSDQGLIDCRVELPINPFNGSAALGRRLAVDIEAFTQRPAITLAPLIGHRDDVPARLERACAPGVSQVIVCRETEDYHRCAKALVSGDDAVLEIGSCHGNCCAVMLLASLLRLNARLCLQSFRSGLPPRILTKHVRATPSSLHPWTSARLAPLRGACGGRGPFRIDRLDRPRTLPARPFRSRRRTPGRCASCAAELRRGIASCRHRAG